MQQFANELLGKQADVFGNERDQQLKDKPLRAFAVFAAINDFAEDRRHLVRGAASNINPVISEDRFLPNRVEGS